MRVVFDTGSDWLVIEGVNCTNCKNNTYDFTDELLKEDGSFNWLDRRGDRRYGSAYLTGREATDTVCLTEIETTCASDFQMFIIDYQEGFDSNIDGILGFSSGGRGNFGGSGPLYIDALKEQGLISERVFAFFLSNELDEDVAPSYMDIGYFDPSSMSRADDLVWLDVLPDDFWWSNYVEGIMFTN